MAGKTESGSKSEFLEVIIESYFSFIESRTILVPEMIVLLMESIVKNYFNAFRKI